MNRRIIVGVLAGLMVPYLTTLADAGERRDNGSQERIHLPTFVK